jgi:hypothetical protein
MLEKGRNKYTAQASDTTHSLPTSHSHFIAGISERQHYVDEALLRPMCDAVCISVTGSEIYMRTHYWKKQRLHVVRFC